MLKKIKRFIALFLAVVLTLAIPLYAFGETKDNSKKTSEDLVVIDNSPSQSTTVYFTIPSSDKKGVQANWTVPALINIGNGFDASYIFSQEISAWGWTDVTAVIPGVDVYAKIRNSVLFYKNYSFFNRKDQEKIGYDPYLNTETVPDYSPTIGTPYSLQSMHIVWDQNTGIKQYDQTVSDSCVY